MATQTNTRSILILMFSILLFSCEKKPDWKIDSEVMASLGEKHKMGFGMALEDQSSMFWDDTTNLNACLGAADMNIMLFIFGYSAREETIPSAKKYLGHAQGLDSANAKVVSLSGKLNFLDWNWEAARQDFLQAMEMDPDNLDNRHWYSLLLCTQKRFDEALEQHAIISEKDPDGQYLIGKSSMLYFARKNTEMRDMLIEVVNADPEVPWGYDWLGMAYIELKDYENSINTYFKAFELADGTVEVGAGLGHALGLGGETELAKEMADYYEERAKQDYVPQVQRAFIHIGIGEHEKALDLLEEAYREKSWFLAFMQAEPWLDPLRGEERFNEIMKNMNFPG